MSKLRTIDKVLFVLSIYVVIELYISTLIDYPPNVRRVLFIIDSGICALFIYDFFSGLLKSDNRLKYFRNNWIDLVSSVPMVNALRIGRVIKIIRILRIVRSGKILMSIIDRKNPFQTFGNLAFIIFILIIISSISFYQIEGSVNPAIQSIWDSFWWTTITTLTIGFLQDISPITIGGRIFSIILILSGMILFGSFISALTDFFIEEESIQVEVKQIHKKNTEIEERLGRIEKMLSDIQKKL